MTTAPSRCSHHDDATFASLLDALLSEGEHLDDLVLHGDSTRVVRHLLGISLVGLLVHGLVVGCTAQHPFGVTWPHGSEPLIWVAPVALVGAFLLAIAVCLPSFYFYTRLAGLDVSFRVVAIQSLRVQARTSVLLLGLLPFYTAIVFAGELGLAVAPGTSVGLGMAMPFVVGLDGIRSLYRSFQRLVERLPMTHERRGNVVLRLVLCWGAVFSAVAPVALWRIAQGLDRLVA